MVHLFLIWLKATFFSYLASLVIAVFLRVLLQEFVMQSDSVLFIIFLVLNCFLSAGFSAFNFILSYYKKQEFIQNSGFALLQKYLPAIAIPLLVMAGFIGIIGGFVHSEITFLLLNIFVHGYAALAIYIIVYQHSLSTQINHETYL